MDPTTGDLDVSTGRVQLIEGHDAIVQILARRLRTILGEWFTGRKTVGVPYYEDVLVRGPSALILQQRFAAAILGSPGVDGLARLDLDMPENKPRTLVVDFEATAGGTTIAKQIPLEI